MELDCITKGILVKHSSGTYLKLNIAASKEVSKMTIGLITLDEKETLRLFGALRAIFEKRALPPWIEVKDLRKVVRGKQDMADKLPIEDASKMQQESNIGEATLGEFVVKNGNE